MSIKTILNTIFFLFVVSSSVYALDLENHEVGRGHTIKEHVGLKRADLLAIMTKPVVNFGVIKRYKKVHGTFSSLKSANSLVNSTISENKAKIKEWFNDETAQKIGIGKHFGSKTGTIAYRTGYVGSKPTKVKFTYGIGIVVTLVKNEDFGDGYQVLTAYPVSPIANP